MILKQYYLGCLGQASYLIGDEESGRAVIVDPRRDVDVCIEEAGAMGLTIRHVFLTHFHADFVAGHLELRDRVGAGIGLGRRGQAAYEFTPLQDGYSLELGSVRLEVLETPGHTPEGISILVYDLASGSGKPHAVLTGDTLFIGDVGRPDLLASSGVTAAELGGWLYDSLHTKLLALPDETIVYSGHGAGSACGKNLSTDSSSTIGIQRLYNYALQPMSKEQFIATVTADQPDAPPYFAHDVSLNKSDRPTGAVEIKALDLAEFLDLRSSGAQVLDVREPIEFEGAHVVGSLNIGLSGQFASWAGTMLDLDKTTIIVGDNGTEEDAAIRLARVGFDQVAGFLAGGMQALDERREIVGRTERVTATTLAEQLSSDSAPVVLDVRTDGERAGKHIQGSIHIPLARLRDRVGEVPADRQVVIHCASGYRSSIAASDLRRRGFADAADMVGGISAWEASKLPTVSGPA